MQRFTITTIHEADASRFEYSIREERGSHTFLNEKLAWVTSSDKFLSIWAFN